MTRPTQLEAGNSLERQAGEDPARLASYRAAGAKLLDPLDAWDAWDAPAGVFLALGVDGHHLPVVPRDVVECLDHARSAARRRQRPLDTCAVLHMSLPTLSPRPERLARELGIAVNRLQHLPFPDAGGAAQV